VGLKNRLLIQCIIDAKSNDIKEYDRLLQEPDSWVRVMLGSIAVVMEKELKNLAKRLNKKANHETRIST
jgi:hypothetical protein